MKQFNSSHILSRRSFVAGSAVVAGAAAIASAAGLAGCSDTSSSGSAVSDATKLTFCLDWTPNTNHTGIYVAKAKGYFADEGLNVEIVQPAEDGAEAMIGTGQAQFGVTFQDYIANSIVAENVGLTAVAAIIQHNTSGIMSRAEDGITRPAAMEGHSYGTWNLPVEQGVVKQAVETDGGDFSKVELVPNENNDGVSSLKTNQFDTVWVYEAWDVQSAIVQDFGYNYFSFISVDEVLDYNTPVIAGNVAFMEKNPEVAKAFLRAVKKGYEFCVSAPDDAADILCDQVPELDSALVRASQAYLADQYTADAASWGVIDPKRWGAFFQWLNDNSLVEKTLDVASGFDMSYLEA
jgi:ABC-type nitrate/sulfonate/bicarbonate transport system substrate-binding protein